MNNNIIKGKSILTNVNDSYIGVLDVLYDQYSNNGIYLVKFPSTNTTTTPTLNLNSIGAGVICRNDGSALNIGQLLSNGWYQLMYDLPSNKFLILVGTYNGDTTWNDIQNLSYYNYAAANSAGIMPQYSIDGNRISLRGTLFIPLDGSASPNFITYGNSYLGLTSAALDTSGNNISIVTNSNGDSSFGGITGGRQGIFLTPNPTTSRNFPINATPISRDIVFSNVIATRRYNAGTGSPLVLYRSFVQLRISSESTFLNSSFGLGKGALCVFSPYNEEVGGFNNSPKFGNDPLALLISRATSGVNVNNYIDSNDDSPFTIPNAGLNNPFSVNAHDINSLGGFYINLEGLTGFIN
jgi:hypothetical protein